MEHERIPESDESSSEESEGETEVETVYEAPSTSTTWLYFSFDFFLTSLHFNFLINILLEYTEKEFN